jgi:hypothetical protein
MNQAEKALTFAQLHEGPGAFVLANAWDTGSARLLAHCGFEAMATTSAGFASSLKRSRSLVRRAWSAVRSRTSATTRTRRCYRWSTRRTWCGQPWTRPTPSRFHFF